MRHPRVHMMTFTGQSGAVRPRRAHLDARGAAADRGRRTASSRWRTSCRRRARTRSATRSPISSGSGRRTAGAFLRFLTRDELYPRSDRLYSSRRARSRTRFDPRSTASSRTRRARQRAHPRAPPPPPRHHVPAGQSLTREASLRTRARDQGGFTHSHMDEEIGSGAGLSRY